MGESDKCVWDDAKEELNIAEKGYAFQGIDEVFDGRFMVIVPDNRKNYGEKRYNAIVEYYDRIINITFTQRASKVRLISVRPASREERSKYHEQNPNQ